MPTDGRVEQRVGFVATVSTALIRNLGISFRVVALNLFGQVRWGAKSVASDT